MNAVSLHEDRLVVQRHGEGQVLLCLHASVSSSQQWQALMQRAPKGVALQMADLLGHGDSQEWPVDAPARLATEVAALLRSVDVGDEGVHLIGHSYGGAVAMQLALQRPQLVRSLTLYEPVAFGVLAACEPEDPSWREIQDVARYVDGCLAQGQTIAAAQAFVNYWHGCDLWSVLKLHQRDALAARMKTVSHHFQALFDARWSPQLLSQLQQPVQLICGGRTRAPAARVAALLAQHLPNAQLHTLPEAGHMGPLTHAAEVARMIWGMVPLRQPRAMAA
ncbi:alpha/beta fold hydrolase [Paucibacter sp. APW11]|uniref:Alpha/beta fold hydrolase n=1 Tax=Roseateles aquae TaxID=3077235 RepID=A0ABU3PDL1_9BURK|nr:alpha/beta fold hydrolase [Paucibacter sp. APW11]MDT9000679.1 alpha/beta fold hydrolase [Paucibacter sp. APW11]